MDFKKLLQPEIHRKIVSFFHQNPSTIDTAKGISTWLGADTHKAEQALEELVKHKILVAHRTASTVGYGYTQDAKIISDIAAHLEAKP